MSRPEWLKFTSKMGRRLCIKLIDLNLFDDSINCDDLALRLGCTMKNDTLNCPISDSELIEYVSKLSQINIENTKGRPRKNNYKTTKKTVSELFAQKNAANYELVAPEKTAEVLSNDDLFIECLEATVNEVKKQFFENYPDKIKRHPSIWFRFLCNTIKLNSPKIPDTNNYSLLDRMWTVYSQLCLEIGINRTIENFQIFSGLSWKIIEDIKKGQNPACVDLKQKIYNDCKNDIVGGLASSFGSSPNQMFIAKTVYGLTENSIVTHVSAAQVEKTADDIPIFLDDKE